MNKPFFDFTKSAPPTPERLQSAQKQADSGPGAAAATSGTTARMAQAPRRAPVASQPGRGPAHPPAGQAAAGQRKAPPARQPQAGSGRALMAGVFILSALVGGGVAGLFLAMQGATEGTQQDGTQTTAISIITPAPRASAPAAPASRAAAEPAEEKQKTASAKTQDRITPASSASAPSEPPAPALRSTEVASAAVTAGAQELRQLTEQVVSALGALEQAEASGTVEEAAAGADRLRESLANLVDAALARGKSDEEIRSLLSEALDSAGNVPAMLRDASGKLDIHRLLASIMPSIQADAMPMSRDERDYFDQLAAEADTTTTNERVAARSGTTQAGKATRARANKPRASGRFFVRNGKRYTIIRRGDTLSDIAYAAYGDVLAYSAILRANKGRISVRNLKPGTRILIPDIATTRKSRKRRARRQGMLNEQKLTASARTAAKNVSGNTAARPNLPNGKALPAGEKPVKVTNFRPARAASPTPLGSGLNKGVDASGQSAKYQEFFARGQ